MLFNSFEFLLFLPIVFGLYWSVFRHSLKWQNAFILAASYFFYGWWSWKFMGLLAASTLIDYFYGFYVASPNRKKAKLFLWLSIINNLGILGVFKYYNFFAQQIAHGFELLGLHASPVLLQVALPVGISFYTFHGMSYVFDIYRGKQQPVRSFVDYAVFVSFFPLLVAGPIERADHLLPQVQKARTFDLAQAVAGCRLILWGLFKKVVVADSLATMIDPVFDHPDWHNGSTLVFAAIAFSFQIYGDFSGYSDIALGTARLFGFELLSNFKFPYFARDIAEFWRRWHVSLSSWFRDYLYIPLGGSRNGRSGTIRNTFIIFIVSGFWHGASWNFIVWGAIHACGYLPIFLLNRNRVNVGSVAAENSRFPSGKELLQMLGTFAFVTLAWIFFRAPDLASAWLYIKHTLSSILHQPSQLLHLPETAKSLWYILPLLLADWYLRHDERNLKLPFRKFRLLFYAALLLLISYYLFGSDESSSFIYFQF